MKKIILSIICFFSIHLFAQNGFYLEPEIGTGYSNAFWQPFHTGNIFYRQTSIASEQTQLNIGYKRGKWQLVTGLGYLTTGVKILNGSVGFFYNDLWTNTGPMDVTAYNRHVVLPLKAGYEFKLSNRLFLSPFIGAQVAYNLPRIFYYTVEFEENSQKLKESQQAFETACPQFGIIGIAQVNIEYQLSNRFTLIAGPSFDYDFTSMSGTPGNMISQA